MKRYITIGISITGVLLSLIWAGTVILHFFYFSPDSPASEWFQSVLEVINWITLNPYILSAIGVTGILTAIGPRLINQKTPSRMSQFISAFISIAFISLTSWLLAGLLMTLLFNGVSQKIAEYGLINGLSLFALYGGDVHNLGLTAETNLYLGLFYPYLDLILLNYVLSVFFFISAAVFGRAILKTSLPDIEFPSRIQGFLFSVATGLGAYWTAFFFIGIFHILYFWTVFPIIIAGLIFGLRKTPGYLPDLWLGLKSIRLPVTSAWLFIILMVLIISSLHAPLFPPHMHDAMNSHLEAPKVFIREHAITFHSYINFNNFPLGIDLLYIPMLMLGRPVMSQVMTFFFFLMCLGMAYEFARAYLNSPSAGMIAAIMAFLMPRFIDQFNHPTVDIGLAYFLVMIILALSGWLYAGRARYLELSGIMLGLSLGVKYTALPFIIILVAWILIQRLLIEDHKIRKTFAQIGTFLLVAIIICFPWYLRNLVMFGNPFFPFYDNIFQKIIPISSARQLKPDLRVDEKQMLQEFHWEGDWRRDYLFLSELTFSDTAGIQANQLGVLPLAIIPLLVLIGLSGLGKLFGKYVLKWDICITPIWPVWMLLFIVLTYMAYWVLYVQILHTRYLFPIIPLLALLGGYTITTIFRIDRFDGRGVVLITLIAVCGMLAVYYFNNGVLHWKVKETPLLQTSREDFLRKQITSYDAVMEANKTLGPQDIVYGLYAENCRFYAKFTLIGGLYGYADHLEFNRHTKSGKELYDYLKNFGCSYLIVDKRRQQVMSENYATIKLPSDPGFALYFTRVFSGSTAEMYKLKD